MKTKNPKVTIVIPAFNEERYLSKTLRSIEKIKTQIPFEVIGVNNASTDRNRTRRIFEAFGVIVIDEPVKGLSKARAAGIRAARGEIIIQLDADSIVPKTFIDEHVNHYNDQQIVGVGAKSHIIGVHLLIYLWCLGSHYFRKFLGEHREVLYGMSSNISYRRNMVLNILDRYESHTSTGEDRKMLALLHTQGVVIESKGSRIDTYANGRKYATTKQALRFISSSIGRKFIWRYEKRFPGNQVLRDVR